MHTRESVLDGNVLNVEGGGATEEEAFDIADSGPYIYGLMRTITEHVVTANKQFATLHFDIDVVAERRSIGHMLATAGDGDDALPALCSGFAAVEASTPPTIKTLVGVEKTYALVHSGPGPCQTGNDNSSRPVTDDVSPWCPDHPARSFGMDVERATCDDCG